ncbi:hypothetical protein [Sphingomonas sp. 35-24ZXX]|uniref:hypothetical protein n=1 Tax=Sphingomonas sp. 35-24ZXX TaxID=1545915 RepID=UPI0012E084C3|nr:hypothetical protein [Sphingomonas sp. 35-24ZXX]
MSEFSIGQVARASGMNEATFRGYLHRGYWRIMTHKGDAKSQSEGMQANISMASALGFAVAAEFVRRGAKPSDAFHVAMGWFAHSAMGQRRPAELFDQTKYGDTYLALLTSPDGTPTGRIFAAVCDDPLSEVFGPRGSQSPYAAILLRLNPIVEHAARQLAGGM